MSGGGGQYELNLTPYIDLMSTLIVFLLMTAVWNSISVLSTDTSAATASDEAKPDDGKKKLQLSVTVFPDYVDMAEDQKATRIPHISGKVDVNKMAEVLKGWKQAHPDKTDVILNTENTVTYKMLINTFDTLVGNEFPDVGVSTQ